MQKKWVTWINISVIVIILLVLVYVALEFSGEESILDAEECIDVNNVASFIYDLCYDAYSKNIFMEVRRSFDSYNVNNLKFSFFDFSDKTFDISDVPDNNDSRAFKIPAEKNPQTLNVVLDIVKDFSSPVCDVPRGLYVKYCPSGISQENLSGGISPLAGVDAEDFVSVGTSEEKSDILSIDLVDRERVWTSICESAWSCSAWEDCEEGIQKRSCEDRRDCFVPTSVPDSTRYCDGTCVEDWECTWSGCSNGYTVPDCNDINRCGTSFIRPNKLKCGADARLSCVPEVECSEWTECGVDYTFMDLTGRAINKLSGTKSRVCIDKNGCADAENEMRNCSVNVDIYTKTVKKCGKDYLGVFDRLDNSLIARIDKKTGDEPYLNIHLGSDDENSQYCDYCFDGIRNGDETGVDCGGGCPSCSDKFVRVAYRRKTWITRFGDWIKNLLI
ncbi:hypothetical protein HN971_02445 [archaeon]|nr:hypothetical protein [archaeon]